MGSPARNNRLIPIQQASRSEPQNLRVAAAVTITLLACYGLTLAPTVTFWDAGEFLAAIRSLGIPHPPGTPLFVLVGNVWARLLSPVFGFAQSVNLLSAVSTAVACGILAHLMQKWTSQKCAAMAGGILAGLMSTVWLNANETEVYAPSLLLSVLLLLLAEKARESREARWYLMLAYLCGLGWSLQLSALVAAPAAFYLAFVAKSDLTDPRIPARNIATLLPAMIAVALLGATATLFMLVRAKHDPAINQGNPATWQAFIDVITRKQYQPVAMFPRQAPFYIQLGNMFEYADWQIALGLHPDAPPSWLRTPFTILYAILGAAGIIWHKRRHAPSWQVMMILFVTATLGVVVYLNMKASPSYGDGFLPIGAKHEARERDYFFALAFACWGLWAGGAAVRILARISPRMRYAGVAVAVLPAFLNWSAVDRRTASVDYAARDSAISLLSSAPQHAVVFANGDNDTYPEWYLQQAEGIRKDITIVTVPLLGAKWYREELARRYRLLPVEYVSDWRGLGATYARLCETSRRLKRPIVTREVSGAPAVPAACK
ncbi:MAG TPA: DUF2723 domain-containing protein [Gemmatimonadaceae bacterium]|nr:DUF2723 domain-containing protein [Gemmatimonadaceae bacterium]